MPSETEKPVAELIAASELVITPCGATSVAWRCFSSGPAVILLHGDFGSWTHWARNIAPLSRRFRLLIPDMPGYGLSGMPAKPYLPEQLARPLAEGLDHLLPHDETVDVVGFPYGGIVAGYLARILGLRVRRVILSGPGGFGMRSTPPDNTDIRSVREGMSELEVDAVYRHNLCLLMFSDPLKADDLAVWIQRENIARARVRCGTIPDTTALIDVLADSPVRLAGLWGEKDLFADAEHRALQEAALRRIDPDTDFRIVPNAGHWLFYEISEIANQYLEEMLGSTDVRARLSAGAPTNDAQAP